MATEVYTVLEFHADGSHGVDVAKLHGTFRHEDDAYLKLKQLVAKKRPGYVWIGNQTHEIPIRELSANELLNLEAKFAELKRQRRKISDDITDLRNEFTRLDDELYEAGASEAELDAMALQYEERQEKLEQEYNAIDAEIATLHDVNNITIAKVGGIWHVAGGYPLEEEDTGYRYDYFSQKEIVASASFYKGKSGTRFFILKSRLQ